MPVFYFCRNIDTISRFHFYCFFSFFLIVSTSCNADKDLSASAFCMMNVPVISALNWTTPSQSPGFTGLNTIQNCVFCTLFDEVLLLSIFFFFNIPYFFCQIKYSPSIWPACIKCYMSNNRSNLFLCYSMIFCILKMEL